MNVQDEILRSVVIHYITDDSPIGSVQLQRDFGLSVSSATIRNHFKKLVEQGLLEQLHSSSGRIPSYDALVHHWYQELNRVKQIQIGSYSLLEQMAERFGIFALVVQSTPNRLLTVEVIPERYIVLEFERSETVIPYHRAVHRYLTEFIGTDAVEILKVAQQMQIVHLEEAITAMRRNEVPFKANQQTLLEIAYSDSKWSERYFEMMLTGELVDSLHEGVDQGELAPRGCVIGKVAGVLGGESITLTYTGTAQRNFGGFLTSLEGHAA